MTKKTKSKVSNGLYGEAHGAGRNIGKTGTDIGKATYSVGSRTAGYAKGGYKYVGKRCNPMQTWPKKGKEKKEAKKK